VVAGSQALYLPRMELPRTIGAPEMVLVRYGELALKGKNRGSFEHALIRNIQAASRNIGEVRVERKRGRMAVFTGARTPDIARRLQDVPGIKTLSPAWGCEATPEAIAELALEVMQATLRDRPASRELSFRVQTSRADKAFPMISTELDRFVAERILPELGAFRIDLKHAELRLGIEVRPERAYVFLDRLPGIGGLPVGTLGRVMCLISGGIDSPVAAYLAMKRGCQVSFVTFHSYPYIGEASKKKVIDLVRRLSRHQPTSRVFVVPFTEIQTTIRDRAPEPYRTVLYRRFMQRLASRLAQLDKCKALLTGESLGQVASQTLENITCIEAAAELPVLRPLLTYDKEEAIELAAKIGTLELSNLPEPDCCTVFMPSRPIIHGRVEVCEEAEAGLDVGALVERALAGTERIDIESDV
jgi:thiamine biosynthesis protein ThiI